MVTAESDRPEPTPVRSEQRICFGLEWYDSEDDAVRQGAAWRRSGAVVVGGFLDGMPCDRAPEFDYTDADGRRLYAVRT
jgi:hypothetical protein